MPSILKCINGLCICSERVESLILSSQISTDPQRRVFLGGETITLTFNLGQVLLNMYVAMYVDVHDPYTV